MKHRIATAALAALLILTAVAAESTVPLLSPAEIGGFRRPVTTKSPEAQRYFDQGLALVYSFDHDNAIRSFQEAARLDPDCAMAWWGIALACGMHINFPLVPPERAALAWDALRHAQQGAPAGTPVEQALIAAQRTRFAEKFPEDHGPLDQAYAAAMRGVWQKFPQDADVGVLFAEAMMNLRPWDLWQPDGTPQPGTAEILATLGAVRQFAPAHPQAQHLAIHALEASPDPAKARAAADALRGRQPALGHMVHMPSHIDVRTGRWADAIAANAAAVEADHRTRARFGTPDGFLWIYWAHNRHMLAYAAMMCGQDKLAQQHIQAMAAEFPAEWVKNWTFAADAFLGMPYEVMVRFGHWDEVIATPEPAENLPIARTIRHAARGIAYAAKGDTGAARAEQAAFAKGKAGIPAEGFYGNNNAGAVLGVAEAMLEGELLLREGRTDEGVAQLREAVKREDGLRYDEPPDWLIPVRHSLGAALMNLGRYREAEQVYREDLARIADNGWSLYGLGRALQHLGRDSEAEPVLLRFKEVWAHADFELTTSCLCQPARK